MSFKINDVFGNEIYNFDIKMSFSDIVMLFKMKGFNNPVLIKDGKIMNDDNKFLEDEEYLLVEKVESKTECKTECKTETDNKIKVSLSYEQTFVPKKFDLNQLMNNYDFIGKLNIFTLTPSYKSANKSIVKIYFYEKDDEVILHNIEDKPSIVADNYAIWYNHGILTKKELYSDKIKYICYYENDKINKFEYLDNDIILLKFYYDNEIPKLEINPGMVIPYSKYFAKFKDIEFYKNGYLKSFEKELYFEECLHLFDKIEYYENGTCKMKKTNNYETDSYDHIEYYINGKKKYLDNKGKRKALPTLLLPEHDRLVCTYYENGELSNKKRYLMGRLLSSESY